MQGSPCDSVHGPSAACCHESFYPRTLCVLDRETGAPYPGPLGLQKHAVNADDKCAANTSPDCCLALLGAAG
eukprot:1137847-Pelagomonas_calceolata.AAC.3